MFEGLRERLRGVISRKAPEQLKGTKQIIGRAEELSQGAHDIKMVVTAKSGNPLFDALPNILDNMAPGAKAEVILIMGSRRN